MANPPCIAAFGLLLPQSTVLHSGQIQLGCSHEVKQEEDDKNEERCHTPKPEEHVSESQQENTLNNNEEIVLTLAAKRGYSPPPQSKQEPTLTNIETLGELIKRRHTQMDSRSVE